MDILIVGLGVIGTTYGYLFQKAGYQTEHFIRKNSLKAMISTLEVELLDGRNDSMAVQKTDVYQVRHCSRKTYDYIFVSVPAGGIESVISNLDTENITGTIVLCCGIWDNRNVLNELMRGKKYLVGYPVAGGNINDKVLNCCVFDHFMLEKEEKNNTAQIAGVEKLFADCGIKLEQPYDMLEWIWLHMAIVSAVVSVAGKHGNIHESSASAEKIMNSLKLLSEVIRAIREVVKIVEKRGVNLKNYRSELLPYKLPVFISALIMKRMFARNILTRRIMMLHGDLNDLLYVCQNLYERGKKENVSAPIFYGAYEMILKKLKD